MKTLLIAAATLVAAAAPALASPYHHDYDRDPIRIGYERQASIAHRIDVGFETGALSRREARGLSFELRAIADLERRYAWDGLSRWEARDLDARYDALSQRVKWERRDGDRWRGDHRGWR